MEKQLKANKQLRANVVSVTVAIICISIGVLHPLSTDAAKSTKQLECTQTPGRAGADCRTAEDAGTRLVMPFHAVTLTLTSQLVSVISSFVVVALHMKSAEAALQRLMYPQALLQLCPVGFIYGLGDFIQTTACNLASAPVVIVAGQSKLLLAALLSKLVLKKREDINWLQLMVISFAALAGTDLAAGNAVIVRRCELRGALLAFSKAGLSSFGAVISEKSYKERNESFWVICFRVQLMMFVSSILLFFWQASNLGGFSMKEFFLGGPLPLCSWVVEHGCLDDDTSCSCIEHKGWDRWTMLATLMIVLNGLSTGLTLRHLSAVSKSVCNAVGVGAFYIIYVLLGFRPFHMAQACIMAIVGISSFQYASEKMNSTPSKKPLPEDVAFRPCEYTVVLTPGSARHSKITEVDLSKLEVDVEAQTCYPM